VINIDGDGSIAEPRRNGNSDDHNLPVRSGAEQTAMAWSGSGSACSLRNSFCGSDKPLHKVSSRRRKRMALSSPFGFGKGGIADVLRRFIEFPGPAFVKSSIRTHASIR
jgi:hypothetical protein